MSLLPPKFQDPLLKTLGPPIRKEQENKPVEVEVSPGIWRVNGKLETRFPENETAGPVTIQHTINSALKKIGVSEIDIPLPEFKVGDRVTVTGLKHSCVYGRSGVVWYVEDKVAHRKWRAVGIDFDEGFRSGVPNIDLSHETR